MSHLAPRTFTASVGESGVFSLSFWLHFALFLCLCTPFPPCQFQIVGAAVLCLIAGPPFSTQRINTMMNRMCHDLPHTAVPASSVGDLLDVNWRLVFFSRSMRTDRSILVSALYYLAWGMIIHAPVCWYKLPEICRVSI